MSGDRMHCGVMCCVVVDSCVEGIGPALAQVLCEAGLVTEPGFLICTEQVAPGARSPGGQELCLGFSLCAQTQGQRC